MGSINEEDFIVVKGISLSEGFSGVANVRGQAETAKITQEALDKKENPYGQKMDERAAVLEAGTDAPVNG